MDRYTLDEIAHFDRCLFPDDFQDSLIEEGADKYLALTISRWILHKRMGGSRIGVMDVYQEWAINDKDLGSAINRVIQKFIAKREKTNP